MITIDTPQHALWGVICEINILLSAPGCMHNGIPQRFVMEPIVLNIISTGLFANYMIIDIS